jgi:hypothetical protein
LQSWFLQKAANTRFNSLGIRHIREEFRPAPRESIDPVAQRSSIACGIGKRFQDFILADAHAQHIFTTSGSVSPPTAAR